MPWTTSTAATFPELYIDAVRHEAARALERGIPRPVPRSPFAEENADPDHPLGGMTFSPLLDLRIHAFEGFDDGR